MYLLINFKTVLTLLALTFIMNVFSYAQQPIYLDPTQPVEKRTDDLLSRMTLEEKIGQLNMPYPFRMADTWSDAVDACRKFAEGKLMTNIGPAGGFWSPAGFFPERERVTPTEKTYRRFSPYIYREKDPEGVREQVEFLNELQKIAVEKTRLGIPLLMTEEGDHGFNAARGTVFPQGLPNGATWNRDLIRKINAVKAKEARTRGIHFLGTLVVEPNLDPRLGRNQQTYGECPYLCSQMAEAIVKGMQGEYITDLLSDDKAIPILSHFPSNSPGVSGLERGAMEISEKRLREVILPPWDAGITKSGALGVMAAYPSVDGETAHCSEKLLTKILREEVGFNGIVFGEGGALSIPIYQKIVSTQKESGELLIKAGVDVQIYHQEGYLNPMRENVMEGNVSVETIDRSVRRILRIKFLLGLFENPYVDVERGVIESNAEENREVALEASRESIVLLKNENNILPLDKDIKSIAVIGPNADDNSNMLGDYTWFPVLQDVITPLEGIKNKVSSRTKINYVQGCEVIGERINEIEKAVRAAKASDVAVVVIGEDGVKGTNGEGEDVASLDLTGLQEDLLKAVHATGTPTVVVLINGRPLSIRWASENIPGIVVAWMCGEQGGNAIADVLFGDYNPDGRLPITFPRHVGQLPSYYYYKPSKVQWLGRGYADMPATPLWEFGFGLSYTTFEYSNLRITPEKTGSAGEVSVSVDIKNTGEREGKEVVQLYINDVISSLETPVRELKGFEKVSLEAGEKKTVQFRLTPEHLSFLDKHLEPVVEPGVFEVMVGSSCEGIHLEGEFEVK